MRQSQLKGRCPTKIGDLRWPQTVQPFPIVSTRHQITPVARVTATPPDGNVRPPCQSPP
jgi:hypothetical protein